MATKHAQPAPPPTPVIDPGQGQGLPDLMLTDPLGLLAQAGSPVGDPAAGLQDQGLQDLDDDDDGGDHEVADLQPLTDTATARKTTRRGFLGAAAGLAGAAAAAAALPPQAAAAQPIVPPQPELAVAGGQTGEIAAMLQQFQQLMMDRDDRLLAELDRRVSAIRAELPVPNGVAHAPAELAARPGQYPPSMAYQQPIPSAPPSGAWPTTQVQAPPPPAPRQQRMVAFIPKEDPFNPRQTTFKTWVNGRELRAKRGQVMILSLGHGVDLARNGHGNCVDIAAMQGIGVAEPLAIPTAPDYSRPDGWNGLPMTAGSSIPLSRAS